VNGRPPQLSPYRSAAGLGLPLVAYLIIRAVIGSATGALAITEAVATAWLLIVAIDGASQIALALTVPTASFVADSTAARIIVLGTDLVATTWYLRHEKERRERGPRSSTSFDRHK
jgi:hypothetical protein